MATETLRPDAAGDETTHDPNDTDNYAMVDEVTADDDTTTVASGTLAFTRDLYNIPDHSVGSGVINYIKVYARFKYDAGGGTPATKIAIKSGTGDSAPDTTTDSGNITISGSWVTYSQQWNTNPAHSGAWTWDEIDNLQIGISMYTYKTPATVTYCTQVYVEVDYTATGTYTRTAALTIGTSMSASRATTWVRTALTTIGSAVTATRYAAGDTIVTAALTIGTAVTATKVAGTLRTAALSIGQAIAAPYYWGVGVVPLTLQYRTIALTTKVRSLALTLLRRKLE